MLKIQDKVREIVLGDSEALYALAAGFMNLSAYAKRIKTEVEERTMKEVDIAGIVVALSRLKREIGETDPLIQEVKINNITTKSPLTEIVYEKGPAILDKVSSLYKKVKTSSDDFMNLTLSTGEVTVICSDRIKDKVLAHFEEKPRLLQVGLASIGISFDEKYYERPNITFSLLRKIAQKRIILAETITTHTEIIFVFHQKDLPQIMSIFQV
jgi:hypothetical protein